MPDLNRIGALPPPTAGAIVSRIFAALVGGYAFMWGFATLGITGLVAAGMEYDEAWMLVMMLAFLVCLAAWLWAFSTRSLLRVWLVLAGGGAAMTVVALLAGQQLLAGI
jgi:hypothetical protein